MARITFEVATRAVHADLWVRVRGREPQRLELADDLACGGKAHADLPEGRYDLFWTISGPPGCPIRVVARQLGEPVLEIEAAIPPRRLDAAGAGRFSVRGREALRAARGRDAEVMPFAEAVARREAARRDQPVTPVTAMAAHARLGSGSFAAAE